mgnify:FL=1
MKASYWQRGENLDYVNSTSDVIEAGTVLDLTSRIGIIEDNINPGEQGCVNVTGVFQMEKDTSTEIAMGDLVYFDGTKITKTSSDTPAGYAAKSAAEADKQVLVKLLG